MAFRTFTLLAGFVTALTFPVTLLAAEEEDFINFAGTHCRAFVAEGRADMAFVMGKAAAKFSQQEMESFNREFARKIIDVYNIDPNQSCVLDVLSMKPTVDKHVKAPQHKREAYPKAKREVAVVAGVMGSVNSPAPVSVSYRLERVGASPWVITNITLNGQPLVDRYRVEYEALAKQGGADAVLANL